MLELKIDPEFKGKIPPLTTEEYKQLEENIIKAGEIFNPIITWNGYIVDGHNRYNIYCENPGKVAEPKVREMQFSDKWDAIAWMCKNQIGQRNLTPEQKEYLIGKQYEAEKHCHGGNRGNNKDAFGRFTASVQSGTLPKERTRERIAKENNIGNGSVIRAEYFAQALDKVEKIVPEFKDKILRGEVKAPKTEIRELRNFEGEELKEKIEAIESGEAEKERKEKLKEAERERREKLKEEREERANRLEDIRRIIAEQSSRDFVKRTGEDFITEFSIIFDEAKRSALRLIRQDREVKDGEKERAFAKMEETIKEIKENYDGE